VLLWRAVGLVKGALARRGHVGRGAMVRRGAVTCGLATSQYGSTALVLAACRGHTETVELLLDRGADLEAKNNVKWPRPLSLPRPGSTGDLCIVCNGLVHLQA
ncbi:MAG: ankyrin repeat domain-containing protein, partial [Shimia sp.]|nr:ankyrin repeat domain-containing protein [Shimia sp.]